MRKRLCKPGEKLLPTNQPATLREVASAAEVSQRTASVVLSGKAAQGRISPATAARVEKAARELGFRHNTFAKTLASGRSHLIGILYNSYPEHHVRRARAAAEVLRNENFAVSMQDLTWQVRRDAEILKELLSMRVEGLLIESSATPQASDTTYHLLKTLARGGFPLVRFGPTEMSVDTVDSDREQAAYLGASHLLRLGHRHLAYPLDKDSLALPLQQRWRGYQRAHHDAGVAVCESLLTGYHGARQNPTPIEEIGYGYEILPILLEQRPRPTALLIGGEFAAIGAIYAAMEKGLRVPDDLAIVAYSGNAESEEEKSPLPLTRVSFPYEAMGREAVRMLQERIGGYSGKPRRFSFAPELLVRGSCGARKYPDSSNRYEEISSALPS